MQCCLFVRQAKEYEERIIKPREEKKQRQKEDAYNRFSGPAWKGEGHALQVSCLQF